MPRTTRRLHPRASLAVAALAAALACAPALALQRAFVSSTGNDANAASGCIPSLPCRSFQVAHGVVDAGGEIVALDAAGYAPVTINKSVSIVGAPGFVAGISVASGLDGVTIATPGVKVSLRNLNINGIGALNGVYMTAGSSLTIENCIVSNFQNNGIYVGAAAQVRIVNTIIRRNDSGVTISGNASADIVNSQFMGNFHPGLFVSATASGTTSASVSDSVASGNEHGFVAGASIGSGTATLSVVRSTASNNNLNGFMAMALGAGTTARLSVASSMVFANGTGFNNTSMDGGVGVFESLGNNILRQNTTASSGAMSSFSGL